LKIDRSFVNRIGQSKQEAIISAIVAMGKAMGMTIVAEGIETTEQLKFLEKLNCDLAQGYLFSKPLPEQDATIYLKNNKPANNHNYLI
jgi:EAL domain-containing protein (putative c-di-GMP-specific phosphodiesterase class I)